MSLYFYSHIFKLNLLGLKVIQPYVAIYETIHFSSIMSFLSLTQIMAFLLGLFHPHPLPAYPLPRSACPPPASLVSPHPDPVSGSILLHLPPLSSGSHDTTLTPLTHLPLFTRLLSSVFQT